jgi:lysophospholipase L1-like esterase
MTINDYISKWNLRFASNDEFNITAADLREFKDDTAQLLESGVVDGHSLTELLLPMPVVGSSWYLTSTGIWEARTSFNAAAVPVPGPNWRRVADFRPAINAASIIDATDAGRSMLTAVNATAQLALVDKVDYAAGKYGDHPAFTRAYPANGGMLDFLLQALMQLRTQVAGISAAPAQPAAPTNGVVNDVAKEFTFKVNPLYPNYIQYKEAGRSGTTAPAYLSAATAYQVGDIVHVTGLAGAGKGSLAYYVAGSGNVPDGKPLTNADAFTGSVVTTPAGPALTAALALAVASIMAGQPITYTVTANGGVGPYAYAVVATNNATGQQAVLGSNPNGSWTPPVAGSYNFDATVTDSSSPVKTAQALTRTLQVNAVLNQAPVASAGNDTTINLPTSQVQLLGTGADPDAGDTIATYQWAVVTGPNMPLLATPTLQNTLVSNLVAGTYQFSLVVTDNHGLSSQKSYVVLHVEPAAAPTLGAPTPSVGAVGSTVTLPGTNLTGVTSYTFNGVAGTSAGISNNSATSITLMVPAGATNGKITVTTAAGTASSTSDFTVFRASGQDLLYGLCGDSLTDGDASRVPDRQPDWDVLMGLPSYFHSQGNLAVAGDKFSDQTARYTPFVRSTAYPLALRVIWIGANDAGQQATLADMQQRTIDFVNLVLSKGEVPVLATLTAIDWYPTTSDLTNVHVVRLAYNAWLRANYQAYGIAVLVDLASDYRLGPVGAGYNTTYFIDKLHMTLAGRQIVADLMKQGLYLAASGQKGIITGQTSNGKAATPTLVAFDDVTDTAAFATSAAPADIEYSLDGGITIITGGPANNIIQVGNQAKAYGDVRVRERAHGGLAASDWLLFPSYSVAYPTVNGAPAGVQPYAFIYPKTGVTALQDYRGASVGPKLLGTANLVADVFGTGLAAWEFPADGLQFDVFDIAGMGAGTLITQLLLADYQAVQMLFEQSADSTGAAGGVAIYIGSGQIHVAKKDIAGTTTASVDLPVTGGQAVTIGLDINRSGGVNPFIITANGDSPNPTYNGPSTLANFTSDVTYLGSRAKTSLKAVGYFRGLLFFKQALGNNGGGAWVNFVNGLGASVSGGGTGSGGTGSGGTAAYYGGGTIIEDNSTGAYTYTGLWGPVTSENYSSNGCYALSPGAVGTAVLDKPVQGSALRFYAGIPVGTPVSVVVEIQAVGSGTWILLGVAQPGATPPQFALPNSATKYLVRCSTTTISGNYTVVDRMEVVS